MSNEPLKNLLEKLCQGDEAAAEAVFREYEPFLRLVVRRMLPANMHAKFDSVDVVQSVWADLIDGFKEAGWRFKDVAHLRGFLVKVTRNRFLDKVRRHNDRELPAVALPSSEMTGQPVSPDPRPSEVAQADELWEEILALCPPEHHEVLLLKRRGLGPAEIAKRTGMHPGSVRRILYELARRLAAKRADEDKEGV
jgi:RNA polymerase sigma-70 factor (ECF subfamily)